MSRLPPCRQVRETSVATEVESVEQVVNRRTIQRDVGIAGRGHRVGVIVAAAAGQRSQAEVPLNEFGERYVIGVAVADVATGSKRRHDDQRNAGTVAEEVEQ